MLIVDGSMHWKQATEWLIHGQCETTEWVTIALEDSDDDDEQNRMKETFRVQFSYCFSYDQSEGIYNSRVYITWIQEGYEDMRKNIQTFLQEKYL